MLCEYQVIFIQKKGAKSMSEEKSFLGKGGEFSFNIPEEHAKQFAKELRFVIKPGGTAGIYIHNIELLKKLVDAGTFKNYDIFVTPKT